MTEIVKSTLGHKTLARKVLLSGGIFASLAAGGFRVDSPVRNPVASEMARSSPPYTDRATEEPCEGIRAASFFGRSTWAGTPRPLTSRHVAHRQGFRKADLWRCRMMDAAYDLDWTFTPLSIAHPVGVRKRRPVFRLCKRHPLAMRGRLRRS